MNFNVAEISQKFNITIDPSCYGEGLINDTFLAENGSNKYILQRINHTIFKNPEVLMQNVVNVTEYQRSVIEKEGGNPKREALTVIKTVDNENFYKSSDGNYYRMYAYIEDSVTYQQTKDKEMFYQTAKAFGKFQNQLRDFDASTLFETIPDFHNTRARFLALKEAIANDKAGRAAQVQKEIDFALAREEETGVVVDKLKTGEIPLRVTHNDTKLNNVLFDKHSGKPICVIDLDTVMPGSLLYDFGDCIRFGASTAAEDEKDLDKVSVDLEYFDAFCKGYLEELSDSITEAEIDLLPFSAKLITFECGIRFLTDFLNGDTYFKTNYPEHNLDRCRTQFKLVFDMENKYTKMKEIVKNTVNKL